MYAGVDIGGTKTLLASFSDKARILEQRKFLTAKSYDQFLQDFAYNWSQLKEKKYISVGVGVPARLDREQGIALDFGNLPWTNVSIRDDIAKITGSTVVIENDAKLAALSEALELKSYKRVLYVTISTGIGYGLIINGVIDTSIGDSGGTNIMVDHQGKVLPWESFSSGRAIVERFGKRAEDIEDVKTWSIIAHDIAIGLIELLAIIQPDIVVFGGGVGAYFERFDGALKSELKTFENAMFHIPPLRKAKRPNEAGIYGCYSYAKGFNG